MTCLRLCVVGLILGIGLTIAGCSAACKSDRVASYSDSEQSTGEPQKEAQTRNN